MLRPIPIIKGKSAEEFHKNINNGKISEKQKKYLEKCLKLFKKLSGN